VPLVLEREKFELFVATRSAALVRSAWLLTGSAPAAQDLVQAALIKTWLRWAHVKGKDDPEAYVRRVMMSTFLTWRRRKWNFEVPVAAVPEVAGLADEAAQADLRRSVSLALGHLSKGQRAVLVLRSFDDLTEAQTAAALGCSVGTVKSQAARALDRLRSAPELCQSWDEEVPL
jgi:RNA polymerase sigma-70 factor (sigma-E family)